MQRSGMPLDQDVRTAGVIVALLLVVVLLFFSTSTGRSLLTPPYIEGGVMLWSLGAAMGQLVASMRANRRS